MFKKKSKLGLLALTGVMSLGLLFGGHSTYAAGSASTTAGGAIQGGGYNITLPDAVNMNPTTTVNSTTQKVILGKIPTIQVDDLTGSGSSFSIKASATPLTEVTPSGGFKSGTTALTPFTSISFKNTPTSISNPNVTASGITGGNLLAEGGIKLYSGTNAGGSTTITADTEIYTTISPSKVYVDSVNYPTGGTPYQTTITLSVVQGL